jgi:hypothetical protein
LAYCLLDFEIVPPGAVTQSVLTSSSKPYPKLNESLQKALETEETDPVTARKLCYVLRKSKASISTFRYPDRGTIVHFMWR